MNIIKPTKFSRLIREKGIGIKINRAKLNKIVLKGGNTIMENVIAIPMNRVMIVGENFDKFIEMHKEESKKAREINHRRAMAIRKNRIEE